MLPWRKASQLSALVFLCPRHCELLKLFDEPDDPLRKKNVSLGVYMFLDAFDRRKNVSCWEISYLDFFEHYKLPTYGLWFLNENRDPEILTLDIFHWFHPAVTLLDPFTVHGITNISKNFARRSWKKLLILLEIFEIRISWEFGFWRLSHEPTMFPIDQNIFYIIYFDEEIILAGSRE